MLATRATKTYRERRKISFNIILNRNINKVKNAVHKCRHRSLLFQKINHLFIPTGYSFVFFKTPRIEHAAAIENKSTTILTFLFWISGFQIRKTIDCNDQWSSFICLYRPKFIDYFVLHDKLQRAVIFRKFNSNIPVAQKPFDI